MTPDRPLAVVTGASSGIGEALARFLAVDGYDVALVARRVDRLNRLADELATRYGIAALPIQADLADTAAPERIVRALGDRVPAMLVNNAGFEMRGPVADVSAGRQAAMIQVNVAAVADLTRRFLPAMIARGSGHVINVGSAAGFQPGSFMAVYFATKAFVLSYSEALAEELEGTGVVVTCLAPGPVDTEFSDIADMGSTLHFRLGAMTAEAVARAGLIGARRGKRLVVPDWRNRLAMLAVRLAPRGLVLRIVRLMQA